MITEAQARRLIETDGQGHISIKPGHEGDMANYLASVNIGDDVEHAKDQKTRRVSNALRRSLLEIEANEGIDALLDYMVNSLHWKLPGVTTPDSDRHMQRYLDAKKSDEQIEWLNKHGMPSDEDMEAAGYHWDEETESWEYVDPNAPLIKGYKHTNDPSGIPQNDPVALIQASNQIIADAYGLEEDDVDEMLPSPDDVL